MEENPRDKVEAKWEELCRETGVDPSCGCIIVRHEGTRLHITKVNNTVTLITIREADSVAVGAALDFPGLIDISRVGSTIKFILEPTAGYREKVTVHGNAQFDICGPRPCRVREAASVSEDTRVD